MPKVIITAQVNDAAKWEAGFRSHAEMFRAYSIKKPIHFRVDGNAVTICMQPENLETFQRSMESKETADAMAVDGVKRETVKIAVLDKGLEL